MSNHHHKFHSHSHSQAQSLFHSQACGEPLFELMLEHVMSSSEIPIQITVDGGTEPQYMFQLHEQLRAQFLPDISSTDAPACVALKSSDNIPIEALWSYFLKYTGHGLKAATLLGKTENYINVANELHIDLFHWLWSRIVQNVNQLVRYWNTHKTRKQSNKYLPSGVAPEEVFQHPESFGLRHAGIPLDLNVVRELRNTLPKSRADCFRWVPLDFDLRAVVAYKSLGSPELTISAGWTIYRRILAIL
ncbi:hypothetical protein B0H13DRAFT_1851527 [Mycena leptocephala]|nr:hypothetical protein B0H13DRAFT_1851527 [Mycena leptocephala]